MFNKFLFAFLAISLMGGTALFGQADANDEIDMEPPVRHIIKLSPFHFADGTFLLSYEFMFPSEKTSLMVSAGIHSKSNGNYYSGDPRPQFGFQEELQLRTYVVQPQNYSRNGRGFWYFKGFYGGVFAAHRNLNRTVSSWDWISQTTTTQNQTINDFSGGVLLGAQFAMGNRFFMDFFTGGGIKRSIKTNVANQYYSPLEPGYNGVIPKAGFLIGIGL